MRLGEQDEPKRGRIDAAVVGIVWRLTRSGHLPGPELVQDLAGFRVAPWVVMHRLPAGEDLEGHDRVGWLERDRFQRRDDRVTTEQRGEPRDAGRQIVLPGVGAFVAQHAKVRQ